MSSQFKKSDKVKFQKTLNHAGEWFDGVFDVLLDASDPDFEKKLMEAIGVKPGDSVQFITPQFQRTDGLTVTYFPQTVDEFSCLYMFSEETLKKLGCQKWDGNCDEIHWLFPKEWYSCIPDGLEVVDINGDVEIFKRGETDDDIRFGCLPYGFIQNRA